MVGGQLGGTGFEKVHVALGGGAVQRFPGLRNVGDPPGGHTQPQRGAGVRPAQGRRDGRDPARLRLGRPALGGTALLPGGQPGDEGQAEQHGERGDQSAQGACRTGRRAPLPVGCGDARFQERPLDRGEHGTEYGIRRERLACGLQLAPPVQGPSVPPQSGPYLRRLGQPPLHPQQFAVGLDPGPQPWPRPDERLVGEAHHPAVDRQQPCPYQLFQHLLRVAQLVQILHLAPGDRAARILGAATRCDEPQQQGPCGARPNVVEAGEQRLGRVGDRTPYAPDRLVRGDGHRPAPPPAPGFEQGMGHQRQPARLVRDIGDDAGGQLLLHDQTFRDCGPDDRLPQLLGRHRAEKERGGAQGGGEGLVLGAPPVEVRPYGDHHARPCAGQQADELRPLRAVPAEREHLLELVDQHHGVVREQGLVDAGRVLARGQDPDRRGRSTGPPGPPGTPGLPGPPVP